MFKQYGREAGSVVADWEDAAIRNLQEQWIADKFRKSLPPNELVKLDNFCDNPLDCRTDSEYAALRSNPEWAARTNMSRKLMKEAVWERWAPRFGKTGLSKGDLQKAGGVTTLLGYNFYDLRGPVFLQYPVNTPFRNSLPREGRTNDGYGTMANWKGTTNPGILPFPVPEGQRGPTATPNEVNYAGAYKEGGVERAVTFTAQFAGEGFADNLADEHLRGLHELWLGEEGTMLLGNAGGGVGGNGFQFGIPGAPVLTQTAGSTSFTTSQYVSVAVVLITGMGYPANSQYGYGVVQSVANGLTSNYSIQGADGGSYNMPGGISAMGSLSAPQVIGVNGNTVTASISATNYKPGAFAYAWYVDVESSNTNSLANAKLYAITQFPSVTITAAPPSGNQPANAPGLNSDNSYRSLEFTGLLSYVASTPGATWTDLQGASLTSAGHGTVTQVETILENTFNAFQTGYTDIWGSPDAILNLSRAVIASGAAYTGFQFIVGKDQQNNIMGGNVISGYVSRYAVNSPTGANVIPIRMHPMIPPGTLYFHLGVNPYPHSRIGNPFAMLVQRDYYSIEWPVTTRVWTFGTYVHEVLASRLPWIPACLTGIGTYSGS